MPVLSLGDRFSTFEELKLKIDEYEKANNVKLWIRSSRTISFAQKIGRLKKIEPNNDLVYINVKYACIHGGEKFKPTGSGARKTRTFRQNCPAFIYFNLSPDGQTLQVKDLEERHSHEISQELFKNLFHQRRLSDAEKKKAARLLSLKTSKKQVADLMSAETDKIVLLKDLTNIQQRMNKSTTRNDIDATVTELVNSYGATVDLSVDDNNQFKCLFFQDEGMKRNFELFPEYVCVNETHVVLELGLICVLILVEDSNGENEIVGVGLLEQNDTGSLQWMLKTFVNKNVKVSETKIIITNMDLEIRQVLQGLFPFSLFNFHAFKIIKRHITSLNSLPPPKQESVLQILQKMSFATSSKEYNALYSQLYDCSPQFVLEYFNANWHSIKAEWTVSDDNSFVSSCLASLTEARVDSINNKLKHALARECSLEEFMEKFYKVFRALCKERDANASKKMSKVSAHRLPENSAERSFEKFLTPHALRIVMNQLSASDNIKTIEFGVQKKTYVVHSFEQLTISTTECTCGFYKRMSLPCSHLFALRAKLDINLFYDGCCAERWSASYYKQSQRVFRPVSLPGLYNLDFPPLGSNKRALSTFEKFKKAEHVTEQLAKLISESSNDQFEQKFIFLKQLLDHWKIGNDVLLAQRVDEFVSNDQNLQITEEDTFISDVPLGSVEVVIGPVDESMIQQS